MLVGREPVFPVTGKQCIHPAGCPASCLEFAIQLLEILDVFLGLRLGDRHIFDCLGEALPQGRPVGPGPGRPKQDLLPQLLCFRQALASQVADHRLILADEKLGVCARARRAGR